MVANVNISGDFGALQRDLKVFSSNFEFHSKSEFEKIMLNVSRFWVKTYNNYLRNDNHPTLAKARLSKISKGKVSSFNVSLSEKSIMYSSMKNHYAPVSSPFVRRWIKRKWNYYGVDKWRATSQESGKSQIFGGFVRPHGSLYVKGFVGKNGFNPIKKTNQMSIDKLRNDLKDEIPRGFKSILSKSLTRKVYNIKMSVNV